MPAKKKLKTDFDTSANLEVYLDNPKQWVRVTSNDFRSFIGKRRINNMEYEGLFYLHKTNDEINPNDYPNNTLAGFVYDSKKRIHE